jgi:hypothetical protein
MVNTRYGKGLPFSAFERVQQVVVLYTYLLLNKSKSTNKCTGLLTCVRCICEPYICLGERVAIFRGLFSREI